MEKYTDFYGNPINATEDDLVNILKRIYDGKVQSVYVAATLFAEVDNILYDFNVIPDIMTRKNYWIAKIYIKNKTPSHYYWEPSKRIIKYCEERNII